MSPPPITQISSLRSRRALRERIIDARTSPRLLRRHSAVARDHDIGPSRQVAACGRLSQVLRPMITGFPKVIALKRLRSEETRHGSLPRVRSRHFARPRPRRRCAPASRRRPPPTADHASIGAPKRSCTSRSPMHSSSRTYRLQSRRPVIAHNAARGPRAAP